MVIENLTRYTPSGKQTEKYVPHDMWENEQGEWVKFEDVKELLKPAQKEAYSNSLQQLKAEIRSLAYKYPISIVVQELKHWIF